MAASPIPIQNIYYLLCYAWNRLAEGDVVDVSRLASNKLADLFAVVLLGGVSHVMRRGLDRNYIAQEDVLAGIRGHVDVAESARRLYLAHGRALCRFDEFMTDTLPNRIIKATARFLARVPDLDSSLRDRLVRLERRLQEIAETRVTTLSFRQVQLHSNNRYYRFLLNVCELVHGSWLVDEQSGDYHFRDFLRDEQRMARVFQDFVLNFYRAERPDLGARAEQIAWKAETRQEGALRYLPRMVTDISLKKGDVKLIIDTKYYSSTLSKYYDAGTIHSGNLYQLLAYLSNVELQAGEKVEGMLLYPVVQEKLRLRYDRLQGFPVRICTVNLARDWREIHAELLELVE